MDVETTMTELFWLYSFRQGCLKFACDASRRSRTILPQVASFVQLQGHPSTWYSVVRIRTSSQVAWLESKDENHSRRCPKASIFQWKISITASWLTDFIGSNFILALGYFKMCLLIDMIQTAVLVRFVFYIILTVWKSADCMNTWIILYCKGTRRSNSNCNAVTLLSLVAILIDF